MRQLLILVILLFSTSCSQKKTPIKGDTEFQIKMNSEFLSNYASICFKFDSNIFSFHEKFMKIKTVMRNVGLYKLQKN